MAPGFFKCLSARRGGVFLLMLSALICLSLPSAVEERKAQKRAPPVYPELARRMHLGALSEFRSRSLLTAASRK